MTADPVPHGSSRGAISRPAVVAGATVTDLRDRRRAHRHHPAGTRAPAAASDRASARRFVAGLVRAVHEVAAGLRPYPQLEPWLAPTIARRLGAELRSARPRPTAGLTIRSVHVAPPTPSGALEATAVLEHGGRVRALAIRLERHHDRWRATELTAPEWGYAPLATASASAATAGPDAFDEAEAEAAARDRLHQASAACRELATTSADRAAQAAAEVVDRDASDPDGGGDTVVVPFSRRRGSA